MATTFTSFTVTAVTGGLQLNWTIDADDTYFIAFVNGWPVPAQSNNQQFPVGVPQQISSGYIISSYFTNPTSNNNTAPLEGGVSYEVYMQSFSGPNVATDFTGQSSTQTETTLETVPGAPTGASASAGDAQATVSFTAPTSDGGSAIIDYTVTSSPGAFTATDTGTTITVTGLSNGTAYTFTVTARNSVGSSDPSSASNSVTPFAATVPGAPTGASATAGNAQATVSFTAPSSNGGSAIIDYTVTSSPGGFTATDTSSPITVTGLSNDTAYTFTVTARNSVGSGNSSSPSNSVTPFAATVPGAPTGVSGTAGNGQVTVTFLPPSSDGGSAITGYIVNTNPATIPVSGVGTSIVVTGLTNGTTYTFRVKAVNAVGQGEYSLFSAGVTPTAGGGGGGAGDPYVTTVSGKNYKLPTVDAPIRFYQGEVDGEMLTVNAQLRTIPSSELLAYNMRSLITLSKSMSAKQIEKHASNFSKEEKLCFFEAFYVKHGDNELQVNVWDGKLKVQKYTGKFATALIDNGEGALKASGMYSNYKGATLAVNAGSANIYLSAYLSPIVRSGIVVDAPNMGAGNGAIVNVLASKDLVLSSLNDTTTEVARTDAKGGRVVKELFSDHAGTRTRNIVTFH
jgi:chitodextrinase